MTLAADASPILPLEQLEKIEPLVAEFAQLMVYPQVDVIFLEGEPFCAHDVEVIYLALIAACAAVHTHTPQNRSWDTPLGVVEVEARGFNVMINGVAHTPETVDRYSQDLQEAVAAIAACR